MANKRIEPMTRSAITLRFQSNAVAALLVMAHPNRSAERTVDEACPPVECDLRMKGTCTYFLLLILGLKVCTVHAAEELRIKGTTIEFALPSGPFRLGLQESPETTSVVVMVGTLTPEQRRYGYLLPEPPGSTNEPSAPKLDLTKFGLQLWLLKADGTIIPQLTGKLAPRLSAGGEGINQVDDSHWFIIFCFKSVRLSEISGVVLQKDGKLYAKEFTVGKL